MADFKAPGNLGSVRPANLTPLRSLPQVEKTVQSNPYLRTQLDKLYERLRMDGKHPITFNYKQWLQEVSSIVGRTVPIHHWLTEKEGYQVLNYYRKVEL